jgi:subtilisin family serine protease
MAKGKSRRGSTRGNDDGRSGVAGPQQTLPGRTGRYIVMMREGAAESGAKILERTAGIRVTRARDFEGEVRTRGLASGEAMLFESITTAVVDADSEQMSALRAAADDTILSIEPERVVFASMVYEADRPLTPRESAGDPNLEYLRGYRDAINELAAHMVSLRRHEEPEELSLEAFAESEVTWGLHATNVLRSRFTGKGVRVAVLDTGFDRAHPDFAGRAITLQSFITNESPMDGHGHGTHCIGTACGSRQPAQLPRYGIASAATIYSGKVLSNSGSGTDGGILAGIDWAVRHKCAVISMSLGAPVAPGEPPSDIYERIAQRALTRGSLIIAAAGNESRRPAQINPVGHPANCPSILAVGAIDSRGRIAPFSCGGLNPNGGQVDIAGPGVDVISSWPRPTLRRTISGTSMATPHVAGIAALWVEAVPSARGRALQALLLQNARRIALPARDVGAGLVQAP